MEADQTHAFNQKLSQWIASQGFWFQLRHSLSGSGDWSLTMSHFMRLGIKVGIVALLAAVGFFAFMVNRVGSKTFVEGLDTQLAEGLSAEEAKIVTFRRVQGDALIRRVGVEGGKDSFFRSLDARSVKFRMPLIAGFSNDWEAGTLQAKWMSLELKAGADSAEHAASLSASLFRQWPGFRFSTVEVEEASLRWGYTANTSGRIEGSRMTAASSGDGWRLAFTGGKFSQNWLNGMEIEDLTMQVNRSGLEILTGRFRLGGGTVNFDKVKATGGVKPEFSGRVVLSRVAIAALLPESASAFVEGTLSTDLTLSGSTNSDQGLGLEGQVTLSDSVVLSLREELDLLKALALADRFHSYRKVDFHEGGFHLRTGGGMLKVSGLQMKAGDIMTLKGAFEARFPSDQELSANNNAGQFDSTFAASMDADLMLLRSEKGAGSDAITLKKAGKASTEDEDGESAEIFGRREQERQEEALRFQDLARRSRELRFSGGLMATLPGDAFERNSALRASYPLDAGSGRVAMSVPLDGALFELTRRQAMEISRLSEIRDSR